MALTDKERDFWQENGYLVMEGVLSAAEVEGLRRAADALAAGAKGLTESTDRFKLDVFISSTKTLQQIAQPHDLDEEWITLAKDPRILDVVEDLLGPNLQLYYSMMMMKPPRQGFEAPWHQDLAFFAHDRAELLACQVYIDNSTPENGCLQVVPGSHKLGLLNHFKDERFAEAVQGDTSALDENQVALPVEAGSMVLWHSLTLHRSAANRSDQSRRAVVFEYKNPETRLLGGAFDWQREVRPVGVMVRGEDPRGELHRA